MDAPLGIAPVSRSATLQRTQSPVDTSPQPKVDDKLAFVAPLGGASCGPQAILATRNKLKA